MVTSSETGGAALVAIGLAQAILATLRAKKIFSDDEADQILENVLTGVELNFSPDDRSVQVARHLAEMIARAASEARQKRDRGTG